MTAYPSMEIKYVNEDGTVTYDGLALLQELATATSGGGVSDGDYGDVVVSGAGTVWAIDAATAASYRDRATHTGTQLAATVSDLAAAVAATAAVTANTAKVTNATHTGDVTGSGALTIAADAVTYAKMQNVSAASKLIGRGDGGAGDPQEITLGTGLAMTGTTLSASGASAVRAGHRVMTPAAGLFVPNNANATALGTQIQVADRTVIAPFVAAYDMTVDQLGVSVSTLLAASNAKGVIYAADSNGQPTTILRESANISGAAAATVFAAITSITLTAGATYWIGVRASGTFTLRTLAVGALPALDYTNAATPIARQTLIKTEAFAGAAVNWTYASSQHSTALMPLILMRLA